MIDAADALAPGPARVALRVPTGAPLAVEVPVTVGRGTASSGSLDTAAGDTVSAPLTVSRSAAAGPVHVSLGLPPAFPIEFRGLKWEIGAEMVLFEPTENRAPRRGERAPGALAAGGGSRWRRWSLRRTSAIPTAIRSPIRRRRARCGRGGRPDRGRGADSGAAWRRGRRRWR